MQTHQEIHHLHFHFPTPNISSLFPISVYSHKKILHANWLIFVLIAGSFCLEKVRSKLIYSHFCMMNCGCWEQAEEKKRFLLSYFILFSVRMERTNNRVYRTSHLHKYKRRFQQEKLIQLANLMLARIAFSLLFCIRFLWRFHGGIFRRMLTHVLNYDSYFVFALKFRHVEASVDNNVIQCLGGICGMIIFWLGCHGSFGWTKEKSIWFLMIIRKFTLTRLPLKLS